MIVQVTLPPATWKWTAPWKVGIDFSHHLYHFTSQCMDCCSLVFLASQQTSVLVELHEAFIFLQEGTPQACCINDLKMVRLLVGHLGRWWSAQSNFNDSNWMFISSPKQTKPFQAQVSNKKTSPNYMIFFPSRTLLRDGSSWSGSSANIGKVWLTYVSINWNPWPWIFFRMSSYFLLL